MILKREDFTAERIDKYVSENHQNPDFEVLSHDERKLSREIFISKLPPGEGLWVFGYGSLIWNPAFNFVTKTKARLFGFHRSFCLHLDMGRGTPERPGLMLSLDNGGSCNGVAFKIDEKHIESETEVLWNREMITGAYRPHFGQIHTDSGRCHCLVFVINRNHSRYTGNLRLHRQAVMINTGVGEIGTCREYFDSTVEHLKALDITDSYLTRLGKALDKTR